MSKGYWDHVREVGSAVGRLLGRAEQDIRPSVEGVLSSAKRRAAQVYGALGEGLSDLVGTLSAPEDGWVAAIPPQDRTPERLFKHPDLVVREEDGRGVEWPRSRVAMVFVPEGPSHAMAGAPVHAAILRLYMPLDQEGMVLAQTPVLTVERVVVPALVDSWEASVLHDALNRFTPGLDTVVYAQDGELVERAAEALSRKNIALSRFQKTDRRSESVETGAEMGWSALRVAVLIHSARVRPLSALGPDFSAEDLLVHASQSMAKADAEFF